MKTPRYEYNQSKLKEALGVVKSLTAPYGLTVRYAIKANPHPNIIGLFDKAGLSFDCSSSYEVEQLLGQEVNPKKIVLSSQQSAENLQELLDKGIAFTATSLNQLNQVTKLGNHYNNIGIRINPGVGSGHSKKVSTGGVNSSFGIWYEYLDQALQIAEDGKLKLTHLHIHIGSGTDPKVWSETALNALKIIDQLPDVTTLNMGGGFKTGYQDNEEDVDISSIIDLISDNISDYETDSGRKIKLEIEPGRFLVAHSGTLIASVDDIIDTGKTGNKYLRLNTGMNDFMRTTLYGAYHRIEVINSEIEKCNYVVVGHNCESADLFSCIYGEPEEIQPRLLCKASIGDEVRIYDTGAYCASMRVKGYNGFPDAEEVFVD